jgi:hemerythrin-like domain-containing protein
MNLNLSPIQVMEAEHRLIETVVNSLSGIATAMEEGKPADANVLHSVVEFLQIYSDQLHHGKEEAQLFPFLIKRGVPPGGCPIGGLRHEHEKGRDLVRTLAASIEAYEQGKPEATEVLIQALRGIVDLYQNHIWKEDAMVFPMAETVLNDADKEELGQKFVEVDRAIGLDVVARLERFAKSLAPTAAQ